MKKQYHGITLNDLYNPLYVKFNQFVDEILNYESDTFSSKATGLTPAQAEKIAITFILEDIEDRTSTRTMDGGMISNALDEISCPRCIEEHEDEEGNVKEGTRELSECKECGVCKDCEHLAECSKK